MQFSMPRSKSNNQATPDEALKRKAPDFDLPVDYEWIADSNELEKALDSVASAEHVGLDLEADNMHHYKEQLCLVQMHALGKNLLIDPLSIADLSPLLRFLESPPRQVWMHGADFDMCLFQAAWQWLPPRVWDTQIAAQLLGLRQFGLAALVENYFGLQLSKSSQREDWSRRPLAPKMLQYAALDAAVMMPLREILSAELVAKGRWGWFEESCRQARDNALNREGKNGDSVWRITGWGNLQGKQLAYLRALWHWRDQEAERRDVPHFKVLGNREIIELAIACADGKTPNIRRRMSRAALKNLPVVIKEVEAIAPAQWPRKLKSKRLEKPDGFDQRFESLRSRRDAAASELGMDPAVIANRKSMELLAAGGEAAEEVNLMSWQKELLKLENGV